ncbi:MAG: isoaspartyl peptidase/L-asparaginase [Pirellulales bacterium]|nr:isoaspartyl peptidase/L-asparaginase [Pirellulales bacterium]
MTVSSTNSGANKFVLAIHGGLAGPRASLSADCEREVRAALRKSLQSGAAVLRVNSTGSVEAVLAAVKVMEDCPHFNAGKGSVYTRAGTIEMDAAVMEGAERRAGAVAHVKRIRNPVLAAHTVMTQSSAVFLVGDEADQFAEQRGLEMVDPSYFATERRWNDLQAWKSRQASQVSGQAATGSVEISRGTVGAVALDRAGNLAAATSTGGLSFKIPGRVGDSGVIGAGTCAENRTCAVSATGDGELFIRSSAAYSVSARLMYCGKSLGEAAQEAVDDIGTLGGVGGLIAIDRCGNVAMPYHALGMFRGTIYECGDPSVALYET